MEIFYESMIILKNDLEEKEREEVFQKIIKRIENLGGKVLSNKIWAKEKDFCFPLRSKGGENKKYYKGCYWLVNFMLDSLKIVDLKETLRLEERILRSLILKREPTKVGELSSLKGEKND